MQNRSAIPSQSQSHDKNLPPYSSGTGEAYDGQRRKSGQLDVKPMSSGMQDGRQYIEAKNHSELSLAGQPVY